MLRYMLNRAESWSSSRHLTAKIRPGTSLQIESGSKMPRGTVVQKLTSPRGSFSGHDLMTPWSKLQELYFVGYAFVNYLSSPFNLAEPGFEVSEIEPHEENGETWRRMVVKFPDDAPRTPPNKPSTSISRGS